MVLSDELISQLFASIYYQPKEDTRLEVVEIISEHLRSPDSTADDCAIDILDYLDLEWRDNKAALKEVLIQLFIS